MAALPAAMQHALSDWTVPLQAAGAFRSGPANGKNHEMLENRTMNRHSLAIFADRPEVVPCLQSFFRQALSDGIMIIRVPE